MSSIRLEIVMGALTQFDTSLDGFPPSGSSPLCYIFRVRQDCGAGCINKSLNDATNWLVNPATVTRAVFTWIEFDARLQSHW